MPSTVRTDRGNDERLRVLIVDDHALFRRGLQMVLRQEEDIDVVGEAGDGHEAVDVEDVEGEVADEFGGASGAIDEVVRSR